MTGPPQRGRDNRKPARRHGSGAARRGKRPPGRGEKPAARGKPTSRRSQGRTSQDVGRKAPHEPRGRRDLRGAAKELPRWVVEALVRVTPDRRVPAALEELGEASLALNEGRFHPALRHAGRAKELTPRDATVREVLGLAAYRVGDWAVALRELRTYRRFSGEATHLPIELDALRALGRPDDVAKAWVLLGRLEARPGVKKEGTVVYASFLLDEGRVAEARSLVAPSRLKSDPHPEDLRLWYVAARAAALDGDPADAVRLRDAIFTADPAFPGMDELELEISSSF